MIYLDNHATTRCDPRVVEAMLPWWSEKYGNPHSSHDLGREASDAIDQAIESIAESIGAPAESIVITSGATESNNLAIRGICTHPRQKRRRIVTVDSEHPAVLDVADDLVSDGFEVVRVPVAQSPSPDAGVLDLNRLADAVNDQTALVSVMWANNEIGAIAPMKEVAVICHQHGAILHSDATQAVGRLPVNTQATDIDLLSATGHKLYGPKGTGLLVVGNSNRRVRLRPSIVGGGQQRGVRSGTMNPAGVIGLARAIELCVESMSAQTERVTSLREQLWQKLRDQIPGLQVNGPDLSSDHRLPGNLNILLPDIEGAAWISAAPQLAFSSGSACSAAEPTPSHVLTAIGRDADEARRSVRFGIGRFNTTEEIEAASQVLLEAYRQTTALIQ